MFYVGQQRNWLKRGTNEYLMRGTSYLRRRRQINFNPDIRGTAWNTLEQNVEQRSETRRYELVVPIPRFDAWDFEGAYERESIAEYAREIRNGSDSALCETDRAREGHGFFWPLTNCLNFWRPRSSVLFLDDKPGSNRKRRVLRSSIYTDTSSGIKELKTGESTL